MPREWQLLSEVRSRFCLRRMPQNRLVLVFAIVALLMSGLALFFSVRLGQTKRELNLTRQQVLERDRMLFRQERAYQHEVAPANAVSANDTVRVEAPAAAVFADELGTLTGEELSALMKAGLPADPEAFLRSDLAQKLPSLLPGDGTIVLDDARILTPSCALARWVRGQGSGVAVLEYKVNGPGSVTWRILDQGATEPLAD
jgi:hypothetical protein